MLREAISEKKFFSGRIHQLFESLDKDWDGILTVDEFMSGVMDLDPSLTAPEAPIMYHEADADHYGQVD